MKRSALLAAVGFLVVFPAMAFAQADSLDTWIDANFDGMPDTSPEALTVGVPDSFAIYVDLTGFPVANWTNFLYYFSIGPLGAPDISTNWFADTASVRYEVSGGSIFPLDNFSQPFLLGIGGSGFSQAVVNGPLKLAVVTVTPVRTSTVGGACITPIVDPYNPYYVFVQWGNGPDFGTFQNGVVDSSCFTIGAASAATPMSWGKVKGLYR
jgi:hypothetical protein